MTAVRVDLARQATDCMSTVTVRIDRSRRRLGATVRGGLIAALCFLVFLTPVRADALSPEEIYQTVLPGVMTLEVETRGGEKTIGTAFLAVREGVAVTAWHLVQDARKVTARFANRDVAEVTGVFDWDEARDVALVQVSAPGRPLNRLCPADPPVGARAYAIGAPKGYEFSISDGLVSQIQVIDGFAQCQISCPISPGNSGGPVLNARGEVLGVVTWSKKDAQNLNFATPSACLRALNAQMPVTQWSGLSRQRRSRQHQLVAQAQQERLAPAPADGELEALRALLHRAAGEPIVVTVARGSRAQSFQVTLPKGFVK